MVTVAAHSAEPKQAVLAALLAAAVRRARDAQVPAEARIKRERAEMPAAIERSR
jgi:hypothetical protein